MSVQSPGTELQKLINGFHISQAIYVAAALGIADLLRDGPRTSDDLANATATHPRSLYRLLRALAAVNVLDEQSEQRFALTPLGECLRTDSSNSRWAWARYVGRPYVWQSWGELLHNVETGETAFRHLHNTGIWEWRGGKPEERKIFDDAMTGLSRAVAKAVVQAYDFSPFSCVVDVGGGQGALLAEILTRHTRLRGVLYDLPDVVASAPPVLQTAGVADRCHVIGGDFFKAVPEGGDAYIFKSVLMDEDDDEATAILKGCRRVMTSSARLVVIEGVVAPANRGPEAKFSDLNMMLMTGGRIRSREEFASLFSSAGFRLEQQISTQSPADVIIGTPV